jgi:hypothetical protein
MFGSDFFRRSTEEPEDAPLLDSNGNVLEKSNKVNEPLDREEVDTALAFVKLKHPLTRSKITSVLPALKAIEDKLPTWLTSHNEMVVEDDDQPEDSEH